MRKGTAETKLESMSTSSKYYGAEHFGMRQKETITPTMETKSRMQLEIERLVQERRQLKKQWKIASEGQKREINILQENIKGQLTTLRRAERQRTTQKRKELARTCFFEDPFKFVKSLFTKEGRSPEDLEAGHRGVPGKNTPWAGGRDRIR